MTEFQDLFDRCVAKAKEIGDGHFTLLRFTTNWRAGFFTHNDREAIPFLVVGKTAEEAMTRALEKLPKHPGNRQMAAMDEWLTNGRDTEPTEEELRRLGEEDDKEIAQLLSDVNDPKFITSRLS
jgi:hypothetical protein